MLEALSQGLEKGSGAALKDVFKSSDQGGQGHSWSCIQPGWEDEGSHLGCVVCQKEGVSVSF